MTVTSALGLFGTLGTPELVILLVILLLIFGGTKLPQLARSMGRSIKDFKAEMKDEDQGAGKEADSSPPVGEQKFCSKCGTQIKDPSAAFCPTCGNALA